MDDGAALLDAARADLARGYSVRAGTRLRQAAETGSGAALVELARALLEGRIPGRAQEARERLEAAAKPTPEVRLLRAGLRYDGVDGAADARGALEDLACAAGDGLAEAAIELALVWQEYGAQGNSAARAWLESVAHNAALAR
ncbi:MAG: hypothetical protein ACRD34_10000, partial [Bryobacteraceae bacterium]